MKVKTLNAGQKELLREDERSVVSNKDEIIYL
jgi:hypothetical protein